MSDAKLGHVYLPVSYGIEWQRLLISVLDSVDRHFNLDNCRRVSEELARMPSGGVEVKPWIWHHFIPAVIEPPHRP